MLNRVSTAFRMKEVRGDSVQDTAKSLAELNETYYVEMGNGAVLRSIRM